MGFEPGLHGWRTIANFIELKTEPNETAKILSTTPAQDSPLFSLEEGRAANMYEGGIAYIQRIIVILQSHPDFYIREWNLT